MQGLIVTKILNFIGTKFIGFMFGTVLLWYGKIDQIIWLTLTAAYMGANVADKYFESKKKAEI